MKSSYLFNLFVTEAKKLIGIGNITHKEALLTFKASPMVANRKSATGG